MKGKFSLMLLFAGSTMCVTLIGCGGGGGLDGLGTSAPVTLTAEQQCSQLSDGYGNFFFCGTKQANLNVGGFADGSTGYCMPAVRNLGLVGYSAVTNSGGAFPVTSQSEASSQCQLLSGNPFPNNCTTYIRCTRS